MAEHIKPTLADGEQPPTPSQQIILDLMACVMHCVVVTRGDETVQLIEHLDGRSRIGFIDDMLIEILRDKGYHVESTDSNFTISQSH